MYNCTENVITSLGFHHVQLQDVILCEMWAKNWMDKSSGIKNDEKQSTRITRKVLQMQM